MTIVKQEIETKDFYQQITDQIIEALAQATNWVMPWHQKGLRLPQNVLTQKSYSRINILSLWMASYKNHSTLALFEVPINNGKKKAHKSSFTKTLKKKTIKNPSSTLPARLP